MASLRLLRFIGAYTVLGFVPLAVSFFLLPVYATHLTPAQYGILTSANISHTFITLFITLGIDGAISVFYFDYDDDPKRYTVLGTAMVGVIGLTLTLAALFALFGEWLFGALWSELPFHRYGWFILAGALSQVVYGVAFSWYRMREDLRMAMSVALGTTLASLAGSVIAIVFVRPDALGALVGKTIGFSLGIAPFAVALFSRVPRRIDLPLLRRLFAYGIPASAYTILLYVLFNGDRVVMQRWFTTTDLGLYSLAATLIMPIEVVLQSAQNAIQPNFYRKLQAKDPAISQQLGDFYVAMVIMVVLGLVGAQLLAEPFLAAFRGAKYVGSAYYVAVLAYSQIFRVQYNAYAFSMFFAKHTKPFPVIAIVSIVFGLGTAWVACRLFGPIGIGIGVIGWKAAQVFATRYAMQRVETVQVQIARTVPWNLAAGAYVVALYVVQASNRPAFLVVSIGGGVLLFGTATLAAVQHARRLGLFPRPGGAEPEPPR